MSADDAAESNPSDVDATEPAPSTDDAPAGSTRDVSSTLAAVRERLRPGHVHDRGTAAVVLVFAVVLARYAAWLVADLGLGTVVFVLGVPVAAYGLYRHPTRATVVGAALYWLAALLVLTPVFLNLPFLLLAGRFGIANPAAFVLGLSDLLFLVVFAALAAVPVGIAYRVAGRPW